MRLLQPSSNIQLSAKSPDRFLKRACESHPQGLGPAVGLQRRHGGRGAGAAGQVASRTRARGGTSGCVEAGRVRQGSLHPDRLLQPAEGARDHAATTASIRAPARSIGAETGDPAAFASFDDVFAAFARSCATSSTSRSRGNRIIERLYATRDAGAVPVAPDRRLHREGPGLQRRRRALQHDLHHAGRASARSPTACRPSSTTSSSSGTSRCRRLLDALARRLRRPRGAAPAALEQDAALRQRRRRTPTAFCSASSTTVHHDRRRPAEHDAAASYHINYLSTTCHVYFGSSVGATPDGRHAWAAGVGRHFARPGRRPAGPDGRAQVGRAHGPRAHGRHAAQPEVHAAAARRRRRRSIGWRTSCAATSRSTATTSSSTWSRPRRCARRRPTPSSTAT